MLYIIILLILFFVCWRYLQQRNKYFQRLNIPSPPALPLFGNLATFAKKPFGPQVSEWTRAYGKVFGIYEGGVPVLVTSDLDIYQDVFVRKYENFHSRKSFPLAKDPDNDKYASMFTARGLRWKRLRTISNPVFSVKNLKKLVPLVETSCDFFTNILEKRCKEGKPFNFLHDFQEFTCDTIARVAFGETRNLQYSADNPYLDLCRVFFPDRPTFTSSFWHLLPMVLPEFREGIANIYHFYKSFEKSDPWITLTRRVQAVVEERKANPQNTVDAIDFVDLFLEAESTDEMDIFTESQAVDRRELKVDKKLLTEEVVGQLMLLLIAGYETTSNSLGYVTYHLAMDQEIQEKLREEVNDITGGSAEITYDMTTKMKYSEQVIKEALRLYPLASFVQARTCMQACKVGKDDAVDIPEGLTVMVDAWTIQRDQSIWGKDADAFRPERFDEVDPSKVAAHWIPFGSGPRVCIGLRFAMIEQKILLARILQKYKICRCDTTADPIELQGAATVTPKSVDILLEEI